VTHVEPIAGQPGDGGLPPTQPGNTPPDQPTYRNQPRYPPPPYRLSNTPPPGQPTYPNQPPYPPSPYQPGNIAPLGKPGWTRTPSLIGAGVVAVLVIVTAIAISANSSSGYNDPDTLAASIMTEVNSAISDRSSPKYSASGDVVTDVFCVEKATHTFRCLATYRSGQAETVEVVVAANGKSWIT
jgi:hypothetical protein